MNGANGGQSDVLNQAGQAILGADTRWIVLGALLVVVIFFLALKYKKKQEMSRTDAQNLGLALLQLYSAPVLLSILVLTQPPAVDQVSKFERQSAGLLAVIFLVAGVYVQISEIWNRPVKKPEVPPAQDGAPKKQ